MLRARMVWLWIGGGRVIMGNQRMVLEQCSSEMSAGGRSYELESSRLLVDCACFNH